MVAAGLIDGVGLAGQKRLIGLDLAVQQHGVGADLAAGVEHGRRRRARVPRRGAFGFSRRARRWRSGVETQRSTVFFARSSWMMPISVFKAMIRMNTIFVHAPTHASAMAIRTLNRLNSVQIFSFRIWPVVFEIFSCAVLHRPASFRARTSSWERPRAGSIDIFLDSKSNPPFAKGFTAFPLCGAGVSFYYNVWERILKGFCALCGGICRLHLRGFSFF